MRVRPVHPFDDLGQANRAATRATRPDVCV